MMHHSEAGEDKCINLIILQTEGSIDEIRLGTVAICMSLI